MADVKRLMLEAVNDGGFLVTEPGHPYDMHRMLCAATTLDEALAYMRGWMGSSKDGAAQNVDAESERLSEVLRSPDETVGDAATINDVPLWRL